MVDQIAFRIAGEGGQGILLAGLILAEAAAIFDGKHAIQTQAYGPQVRGGVSRSDIIISSAPILFPLVVKADFVLALSQKACDDNASILGPGGTLVVDSERVQRLPRIPGIVAVPFASLCIEATGKSIAANILSLGFVAGLTNAVSRQALERAVEARAPRGTGGMNQAALAAGYEQARALQGEGTQREILEALLQLAERGSVAAVARLRGVKEDKIDAWVRGAVGRWRALEGILRTEYHFSKAQIDALWRLITRRGEKGTI